ncbi:MAG: hypothetical protein PHF18_05500 [Methanosarcina sp.]|uniref:hypothetical protein n=1 Tax=Methanosarcina sp. TaxID=2213 RepID=UPI002611BEC5|nr:hypothetical protein [Methanosarcina sp.]MDD3246294.1 hypothetical protein [Methanosarcina sp.]MDD4250507.1 hypothetical protein [Methanosarcina sp.]
MRFKRALLPFVFILFLVLPATNIDWIKCMENSDSAAVDLPTELTEGELTNGNDGKYRDGVIDNFDYFVNPGYPSGFACANGNQTACGHPTLNRLFDNYYQ